MKQFKYDNTIYLQPVPDEIVSEIREVLGYSPNLKITWNLKFDEDLGFDELDFIDLIMYVERDFRIHIPDGREFNKRITVGTFAETVDFLSRRKAGMK